MKVGDYVRIINTLEEYVEITKVKKIFPTPINEEHILDYRGYEYNCDEIIKSSPNIIDLIEVGDYVNGSYIYSIVEENKNTGQPRVLFTEEDGVLGSGEIKSIVTHEQFSQMEYRIGE